MNTNTAPSAPTSSRSKQSGSRILLPFSNQAISRRAFDAAIRLAQAEGATLMPAFLARVPRNLPLDSPLPGRVRGWDAAARGDRAAGHRGGHPR